MIEITDTMMNMFFSSLGGGALGTSGALATVKMISSRNERDIDIIGKRVKSVEDKTSALKAHVAENYVPKRDFQRFEDKIDGRFDHVEDKIDDRIQSVEAKVDSIPDKISLMIRGK